MKRLIPVIVIALFLSSACKKEDGPPNIIGMLTDDKRLNSLSCYEDSWRNQQGSNAI